MRLGVDRIYGASERREKSGLGVYLKNRTMFDNLLALNTMRCRIRWLSMDSSVFPTSAIFVGCITSHPLVIVQQSFWI